MLWCMLSWCCKWACACPVAKNDCSWIWLLARPSQSVVRHLEQTCRSRQSGLVKCSCCVEVVDGGRVWAQQAGDPRVAWLTQQLASASLSSNRVSAAALHCITSMSLPAKGP